MFRANFASRHYSAGGSAALWLIPVPVKATFCTLTACWNNNKNKSDETAVSEKSTEDAKKKVVLAAEPAANFNKTALLGLNN
jgi:hypothetical protein